MARHLPAVTAERMRTIDRLAVEAFGLPLLSMMENAGRGAAELARRLLGGSLRDKRVIVAAGGGNNGGGGLAAARHLHNAGARVQALLLSNPAPGAPRTQRAILQSTNAEIYSGNAAREALRQAEGELILDALVGYGLSGPLKDPIAEAVRCLNAREIPVLALDVPSGLDATTGTVYEPCVRAAATLTLALPKTGLLHPEARAVVGDPYLADIGIPPEVYRRLGFEIPSDLFAEGPIVAL